MPLLRAADRPGGADLADWFGRAAAVVVPVLLVAGVGLGWMILGSATALLTTDYGLALLFKVALVASLLALAAMNKLRIVPALQAGKAQAAKQLQRSIHLEMVTVGLIFAVTAVLTTALALPN